MANVASLQVVIGAKIDGFQKQINAAQKILKQKLGAEGLGISRSSLKLLGGLGAAITAVGTAAVHAAAQMEQTNMAFSTLLKSSKLAKVYLEELTQFAASTPFSLPGVLSASKRLLAFGFTAQQTLPIMTALGDAAAGLGMGEEGIDRLTLAVGQMLAKGKVSAEEMLQLAEAGIPAWQMLADKIGTSIPEAMSMAQKGMVNAATGIQAIMSGIDTKFGGMMKNMSSTVIGMVSNIKDSTGQLMTVIGQQITDNLNLKAVLNLAMNDLGNFTDKVKTLGIGNALRECVPDEVLMAFGAIGTVIVGTAIPALVKLGLMAASTVATFVGMTGPIGVVIAAIGAGATWAWKHWDFLKAQMTYICDTIAANFTITTNTVKLEFASMVDTAASKLDVLFDLVGIGSDIGRQAQKWANETQEAAKRAIESAERVKAEAKDLATWTNYDTNFVIGAGDTGFKAADIHNLGLENNSLGGTAGASEGIAEQAKNNYDIQKHFTDAITMEQLANIATVQGAQEQSTLDALAFAEQCQELKKSKEQEFADFMTESNETMINQFSNGLASAVLEGENLSKTFKNIGKNIASMFLTWMIQRRAQAALDMMLGKKNSDKNAANAIKEGQALTHPAIQKSIAIAGPWLAPGAYAGAMATMKGIAAGGMAFANGGYVTGPGSATSDSIPAMLSNGEYVVKAAAVRDVGLPALNAINAGRGTENMASRSEVNSTSITLQVSALDAGSFEDFLGRGGLDKIKQALLDDGRGFGTEAGTW